MKRGWQLAICTLSAMSCSLALATFARSMANGTGSTSALAAQNSVKKATATVPAGRNLSAEDLFRKVSPSVFVVKTIDPDDPPGKQGSAVVVDPNYLITNYHVVEGAVRAFILRGSNKWVVKHFTFDKDHDLALLKVDKLGAPFVALSPSSKLAVGQRVYAVGAPEGLELTLSEGLVSSLRKSSGEIQTTAAISPGSSGGGLFNNEGQLVGITAASVVEGQALNFALPTEWIRALAAKHATAEKLIQDNSRYGNCLALRMIATLSPSAAETEEWKRVQALTSPDPACSLLDSEQDLNVQGSDRDPLSAYHSSEGVQYLSAGKYQLAEAVFGLAIDGDPDNPVGWEGLSMAFNGEGEYTKAAGAAKEALEISPDAPAALGILAQAYYNLGDCIEVVPIYQKLKLLAPQMAADLSQDCVRCNLTAY